MDELLRRRLDRVLEGLSDEQIRRVIDYAEFLQSKYADRATTPSPIERLADGVEDTLRVTKLPFAAIKGTRDVLDTADRVVRGITDAGQTVVEGIREQLIEESTEEKSDRPSEKPSPDSTKESNASDG